MRISFWLLLVVSAAILPAHVAADVTRTDLQVAARALTFMQDPLSGVVRVGIVHAPVNARSVRQAREVNALLDEGLQVGNIELRPVLVTLDGLASADVDIFLLTEHVGAGAVHVAEAGKMRGIPCVTTDIDQVRVGACVLGVRSRPKVEILVHRDAARDSGVAFATVFRVMVSEL